MLWHACLIGLTVRLAIEAVRAEPQTIARSNEPKRMLTFTFRSTMASSTRVGATRSGVLCLPSGGLDWMEVRPDRAMLVEALDAALVKSGSNTAVADDVLAAAPVEPAVRLAGTLVDFHLNACIPRYGLLKLAASDSIRGSGSGVLDWRVAVDRSTEPRVVRACFDFRFGGRAKLPDITAAVIARRAVTVLYDTVGDGAGKAEPIDGLRLETTDRPCA